MLFNASFNFFIQLVQIIEVARRFIINLALYTCIYSSNIGTYITYLRKNIKL